MEHLSSQYPTVGFSICFFLVFLPALKFLWLWGSKLHLCLRVSPQKIPLPPDFWFFFLVTTGLCRRHQAQCCLPAIFTLSGDSVSWEKSHTSPRLTQTVTRG